jgi:hypothetical protein
MALGIFSMFEAHKIRYEDREFTAFHGILIIILTILMFTFYYKRREKARSEIKKGDYSWWNVRHADLPVNKRWTGVILLIFITSVSIPLSYYVVSNFVTNANLGLGLIMASIIYPILIGVGYVAYHNRNNKNHLFYYAFHNKSYSLNSPRMYFIIISGFLFFIPLILLLTGLFPSLGDFIANFPNSLWMDSSRPTEVIYP